MKTLQTFLVRLFLANLVLTAAVGSAIPSAQAQLIKIDGSSTVYPISEAVAEEFQKIARATKVTVGISGTGGGFKKFCRGETDISDASRPIKKIEMDSCKKAGIRYIELPVAFDALSVMVHPANNWAETMTVEQLKKIWEPKAQGKITHWSQVNPSWPNQPIKLYGPGVDSGTFDYFTEAIVGKSQASRGDFTASEDDNVLVQGIANDPNSLGYFGFAYYKENSDKLKAVAIKNGDKAVKPSARSVENGSYQPLSRPIFIYVREDSLEKLEVRKFVEFYLKNAASLAAAVGYVGLPGEAYDKGLVRVRQNITGTVFDGKAKVGLSIEELMAQDLKS